MFHEGKFICLISTVNFIVSLIDATETTTEEKNEKNTIKDFDYRIPVTSITPTSDMQSETSGETDIENYFSEDSILLRIFGDPSDTTEEFLQTTASSIKQTWETSTTVSLVQLSLPKTASNNCSLNTFNEVLLSISLMMLFV